MSKRPKTPQEAYTMGYNAFQQGNMNPYTFEHGFYEHWVEGFERASRENEPVIDDDDDLIADITLPYRSMSLS